MKEPISNVYNCDCLEYMKTLPDKFYDLILADPPYGDALPDDRGGCGTGSGHASTATSRRLPPPQHTQKPYNRFGGRFNKYKPVARRAETGSTAAASKDTENKPRMGGDSRDTQPTRLHTSGGRTQRYYPF